MTDKILIDRAVVEQALDALEDAHQNINPERRYAEELQQQIAETITTLHTALEATHHHCIPKELEAQVNDALGLAQQPAVPPDAFHNAVDHLFDEHGIAGVSPAELWEAIRPTLVQQPALPAMVLREVGLTRDTAGVCIVTVNGREAIRDNGDVISHFATLDWFQADPLAEHAIEELLQLGYTVRGGDLYPPQQPAVPPGSTEGTTMNKQDEKNSRIEELTRTLAYANSLGVRAELCGDAEQLKEAKRIYSEAKAELSRLKEQP